MAVNGNGILTNNKLYDRKSLTWVKKINWVFYIRHNLRLEMSFTCCSLISISIFKIRLHIWYPSTIESNTLISNSFPNINKVIFVPNKIKT